MNPDTAMWRRSVYSTNEGRNASMSCSATPDLPLDGPCAIGPYLTDPVSSPDT